MARDFAKAFYKSKLWQDTREYILKRDAYICQHCGMPATEVHHIIHLSSSNINDPSVCVNPSNLISLCRDCHFAEHRGEHGTGRKVKEESIIPDYDFDENGMLIPPKKNDGPVP